MTDEVTTCADLEKLKGWQYEHHDLIFEVNTAVSSIAASAADAPIRDTRLDNVESSLASILLRLVALETAASITPKPAPTPKPLPEPKPIVVPVIKPSVVTPVEPVKPTVKKRKTKRQTKRTPKSEKK